MVSEGDEEIIDGTGRKGSNKEDNGRKGKRKEMKE